MPCGNVITQGENWHPQVAHGAFSDPWDFETNSNLDSPGAREVWILGFVRVYGMPDIQISSYIDIISGYASTADLGCVQSGGK